MITYLLELREMEQIARIQLFNHRTRSAGNTLFYIQKAIRLRGLSLVTLQAPSAADFARLVQEKGCITRQPFKLLAVYIIQRQLHIERLSILAHRSGLGCSSMMSMH